MDNAVLVLTVFYLTGVIIFSLTRIMQSLNTMALGLGGGIGYMHLLAIVGWPAFMACDMTSAAWQAYSTRKLLQGDTVEEYLRKELEKDLANGHSILLK